ncbi:hypothetical protein P3T76_014122 [Phytophthora citrophthora]|uniref:Uncharacterized protein n=1 Tax=Phytophthora citrophthora TaxID=4793 RepID=A0AAD9G1P7_9STRA|nr:hypothetical protein P3T76_014122 [Phytophthora citrophthora]
MDERHILAQAGATRWYGQTPRTRLVHTDHNNGWMDSMSLQRGTIENDDLYKRRPTLRHDPKYDSIPIRTHLISTQDAASSSTGATPYRER